MGEVICLANSLSGSRMDYIQKVRKRQRDTMRAKGKRGPPTVHMTGNG